MKTYLNLPLLCIAMTVSAGSALADNAPEPDAQPHDTMMHDMEMQDTKDPHALHHMMMVKDSHKIVISTADYSVPDVKLVRDDGKPVSLPDELNDGRPVVMNFIFTTCTEICPITSHIFEQLQGKLGNDRDKVHMVSITIDPEQDTPERLAAYGRKYDAGPQWRYYTGTIEASVTAQRAFDVYRGNKMNHSPVTLLRAAPGKSWLRIEGFASADELLREYRSLVSAR